jgi:DNA-binding MarR family transcriptional regulator
LRDGRRSLLRLTAKARATIADISPRSDAVYATIELKIGASTTAELINLLDNVATKLESQ